MKAAREKFVRFLADDSGATAIEYAMIAGIIVIAIVGGVTAIGTSTGETFNDVSDGFPA